MPYAFRCEIKFKRGISLKAKRYCPLFTTFSSLLSYSTPPGFSWSLRCCLDENPCSSRISSNMHDAIVLRTRGSFLERSPKISPMMRTLPSRSKFCFRTKLRHSHTNPYGSRLTQVLQYIYRYKLVWKVIQS
jgi:hypothetical protein